MTPDLVILTGRREPPAARTVLHAGPVTVELDGADLRRVRIGGAELVQRVYVAVRDAPWNTIPATFSDWTLDAAEDRFTVAFSARHAHEAIDFQWRGRIEGLPDGTIRYELDGVCHGVFEYSKIGFNVHHGLEGSVGRRYRILDEAGESRDGTLPDAIDPQRIVDGTLSGMFEPYREIAVEVADGLEAVIALEGDLMELQDHRNWTDANFKSYGTPLALGFPFTSEDGRRIRQVLTLSFRGHPPAARPGGPVRIAIGEAVGPMPAIGLGQASDPVPLTEREASLLRAARPAHLRVDLDVGSATGAEALERGIADARAIGADLELAIHANEGSGAALDEIAQSLEAAGVAVARVLVYERSDGYSAMSGLTPAAIVGLVRTHLEPVTGRVPFAGGTNQNFSDVNRDRPSDPGLTGLCFSISPTVHAADDLSVIENAAGAGEVVRMARSFAAGRPVSVSPVTIATRFGPYPAGPSAPGDLPAPVDVRQASLLGAAWTLAALKHLAEQGASSVTWYETAGWRGVVERDAGAPHPAFPSTPGEAFPLFHVLADAAEWGSGGIRRVTSAAPLVAEALAVEDSGALHLLVANLVPEETDVEVAGLPDGPVLVRALDAGTAGLATTDPMGFRGSAGVPHAVEDGGLRLRLGAYAVLRVSPGS